MGIYDRDYIKEEYDVTSSGRRYQARQILIGVNVFVWILWLIALDRGGGTGSMLSFMNEHFTASFWHLKQGFVHTLVTAAFSHSDLRHILFNMIALWIFAQMIEERYGYRNTFGIYIGCGVLSSLLHCLGYFTGPAYAQVGPALGASGSVMGLSVIAAMLHPKRYFHVHVRHPDAALADGDVFISGWMFWASSVLRATTASQILPIWEEH